MTPPAAAAAPAVRPRRTVAPGRPLTAPSRPRRVSGPARPATRARPVRSPSGDERGLALGVLGALNGLSSHRFLDRLIRGRISIALVAFALIGIVTLQLGLLKLNASIGRTLEREGQLQRENAALSIENSELAAGDRVESRAAQLQMRIVPLGALRFLAANPRTDPGRGAAALRTAAQAPSGESREGAPATSTSTTGTTGAGGSSTTAEQATGATASGEAQSQHSSEASPASSEASPASGAAKSTPGEAVSPAASGKTPSSEAPTGAASPAPAEAAGSAPVEASPAGGTQAGSSG